MYQRSPRPPHTKANIMKFISSFLSVTISIAIFAPVVQAQAKTNYVFFDAYDGLHLRQEAFVQASPPPTDNGGEVPHRGVGRR